MFLVTDEEVAIDIKEQVQSIKEERQLLCNLVGHCI
jgi:hypothetical protein